MIQPNDSIIVKRKKAAILLFLLFSLPVLAQEINKTLSPEELTTLVRKFHPVAKQADINIQKAKAGVTIARGGFDPYFYNSTAQKTFDGNDYYYYNRPEISVPTWFGISINGGAEFLSGNRTDPQETKGETSYLGISVPLAKNLLMDKRRAALQTAKIFKDASAVEKRRIINTLLEEALNNYWSWVNQYKVYLIISDAIKVNEKRINLIRISVQQGDKAALDTTEALTQLQQFQLLQTQALLEFQNQGIALSNYLWTINNEAFDLPGDIIPDAASLNLNTDIIAMPELSQLLTLTKTMHPELQLYDFKLKELTITKKLKFQELLPTVNFQYNQLGKGYDVLKTASGPLFENNFQYGIGIGIPLRFSAGRGEYKLAKLRVEETKLQQNQKLVQLETKVKAYYNSLTTLKNQISIYGKAVQNYLTLLRGEETRFSNGESSLFLVNSRESKSLEAIQKLTELKTKYFQTSNTLMAAAGLLQ